ncbi:hypothetical protein 2 [Hubei sobemo-like virus 16]|uniref:hypothetical protein 2 n=1 Tax=Hubei sobemo-like virus 16 TaxID=1923201 RepID=UPI0009097EEE|nr:hypothetical protein 2 [Hubei sobemo-like virus 16]APG75906.1 hypothetical protein 2 [Hubei sobemo-like virus 16]
MLDKAYRIIHGVSIIDNLVARLLFGNQFDNLISNWSVLPSKVGWTPGQGGYKLLAKKYPYSMSADKSAWDWTMQPWCVDLMIAMLRNLGPQDEDYSRRVENHLVALFGIGAKFIAGNTVFTQRVQGIMKSGYLGTIHLNSILQTALHILAKIRLGQDVEPYPDSVGDDTIQRPEADPETYFRTLELGGCVIKQYETVKGVDFVGHRFNEQQCLPNYRSKHCYRLFHAEDQLVPETLEGYQYLYPHDTKFLKAIHSMMVDCDAVDRMRSPSYLRYWYDYAV